MARRKAPPLPWLPPGVIVGGLLPALTLLLDALADRLGAAPVKQAIHQSGQLAIILLLLSLACTPLRRFLGWAWPTRLRKPLGLLAFFYAGIHFALYLRSQDFSLRSAVQDVTERPFIASGFAALLLLLPLALTSTPGSVRRLGFAAWARLHRLVYLAAGLAALHYWWGVKQDKTGPLTVILILAGLLLSRLGSSRPRRAR